MKVVSIDSPPVNYSQWASCFEKFEPSTMPDDDFESIVSQGLCPEYKGIRQYIHPRIESVVNTIINTAISELKRDLNKFMLGGEISGMHIVFVRFSKRINKAMFFLKLQFLDQEFKTSLKNEVIKQVDEFWKNMLNVLKKNVGENNILFEEELFLIKRIKLFRDASNSDGAFNE